MLKVGVIRNSSFMMVLLVLILYFASVCEASVCEDAYAAAMGVPSQVATYYGGTTAARVDPFLRNGYLNVTYYPNVDKTGVADSADGILQAMADAVTYELVLYFPTGTYRISKALRFVVNAGGCDGGSDRSHVLNIQGSTLGARPTIRLDNAIVGFGDAGNPRPVIHICQASSVGSPNSHICTNDLVCMGGPNCNCDEAMVVGFNNSISNINIDVGKDNPGAIGLRFMHAQGSYLADIKVFSSYGSSFYSGFYGYPGSGAGLYNCEVEGGQYGMHLTSGSTGSYDLEGNNYIAIPTHAVFVNIKLKNQTNAAIVSTRDNLPAVFIGLDIVKQQSPAIVISGGGSHSAFSIWDAKIDITNGGNTAVINQMSGDRGFYLRNVYFRGVTGLIKPLNDSVVNCPGSCTTTWTRVGEYAYVNKGTYSTAITVWNLINGSRNQTTINSGPEQVGAPAENLVTQHSWGTTPTFEDSDAINIRSLSSGCVYGDAGFSSCDPGAGGCVAPYYTVTGHDDTTAFRNAITNYPTKKIFVPRGRYRISDTLTLGATTKMFGTSRSNTRFYVDHLWNPGGVETPVITTVDSSTATTYFSEFAVHTPYVDINRQWFNKLYWKAGKDSIVRFFAMNGYMGYICGRPEGCPENVPGNPIAEIRITGNGGGRWYGQWLEDRYGATRTGNVNYRILRVTGTTQPLTFYAINPEHAEPTGNGYLVEFTNAKNVRILASKVETRQFNTYNFSGCENIVFSSFGGHSNFTTGESALRVYNSTKFLAVDLGGFDTAGQTDAYKVIEPDGTGSYTYITDDDFVAVYKRGGEIDWTQWDRGTTPSLVPTIFLTPSSITQTCTSGTDAASQTFTITNSGSGTLSYTITDDKSWMVESPTSGTSTGEADTITITYGTSGLAPGTYTATITVTDSLASNNPQTIPLVLTVVPPNYVKQWDVFEKTLTSTNSYTNVQRYGTVTLSATFTGPGPVSYTVHGFWDGGNNWKVRFAPTVAGTWTYTITSSDSQLNNIANDGAFICTAATSSDIAYNPNYRGFLKKSANNRYLTYADTTPFLYVAEDIWDGNSANMSYPQEFQTLIDNRRIKGYTAMNILVGEPGETDPEWLKRKTGINEGGYLFNGSNTNWDEINPANFQNFDLRIKYIIDSGMVPAIFGLWGQDFTYGTDAQVQKFWKYIIARYQAYNVIWVVCGEYYYAGDNVRVAAMGTYIRATDGAGHIIGIMPSGGVGQGTSRANFSGVTWLDVHMEQTRISSPPSQSSQLTATIVGADWTANDKLLINAEGEFELFSPPQTLTYTADNVRKDRWTAILYGAFATGHGVSGIWNWNNGCCDTWGGDPYPRWYDVIDSPTSYYVSYMKQFLSTTEWWKLSPNNGLVSGGYYCLAETGKQYLVYLKTTGTVTVNLSSAPGTFNYRWYDPKLGVFGDWTSVVGGASRDFTSPYSEDGVLYIKQSGVSSPTVTSFTVSPSTGNRIVPITSFTATDDVGVTGYLVNESIVPPSISDSNWRSTNTWTTTGYTFTSDGAKTLYAWVKDADGNVSTQFTSRNVYVYNITFDINTGLWTITGLPLQMGTNTITIKGYDASGNVGTDTITVTRQSAPAPFFSGPRVQGSIQ